MAVDEKYGQLYTEADIERAFADQDPEVVEDMRRKLEESEIPVDEPVFVLRAQDNQSVPTITYYLNRCGEVHCQPAHLSSVMNAEARFKRWQIENPDAVKLPD